jgi:hypothetical protein
MNAINTADLDFSTLSSKNKPMLRYKNKLFKRGKIARNYQGIINNCYWSCATAACKATLKYSINVNHPNLNAVHNGLGPGIVDIVLSKDHCYDVCNITPNDIAKRVARTEIINQAATGII